MNVEHLGTTEANRLELNKLKQSAEKTSAPVKGNNSVKQGGEDKLSISSEARNLQHTDQAVKSKLNQMSDIRPDLVEAIRGRLKSGYYNNDEVLAQSADAVIQQSSKSSRKPEESTINVLLNKLDEEPAVRQNEMNTASGRVESGFYDTEEPIRKTAEKLWIPPIDRR